MFYDVLSKDNASNEISEAAKRPTAAMLLNHSFSKHDPEFNFSESKLGKYLSHSCIRTNFQGSAFWAEIRVFGTLV